MKGSRNIYTNDKGTRIPRTDTQSSALCLPFLLYLTSSPNQWEDPGSCLQTYYTYLLSQDYADTYREARRK